MQKIAVLGGRVIDPLNKVDANNNLYIAKDKVVAICPNTLSDFEPDFVIEAKNKIVCPGFVDINANLLAQSSDPDIFVKNLDNAATVGITHLTTHAFTTDVALEAAQIEFYSQLSGYGSRAKVFLIGALTQNLQGMRLNELMLLKEAGCIGFSNGCQGIINTLIQQRCYEYAGMLGLSIYIKPNDSYLAQGGCMHEGKISASLGVPGIPPLAETVALVKELALIEDTGIKAHFHGISSAKSIELLKKLGSKVRNVSSDVAVHQLFFTEDDVRLEDGFYHVMPPFRTISDRKHLREAVKSGQINAITSDHITLPTQAKEIPFQDSAPGIASWPLLLPLTLKYAAEENVPLLEALERITSIPATILGIDAGHLTVGSQANVVIFDPNQHWKLSDMDIKKFGANSPCLDWQLQGLVHYTIIDGHVIHP